MINDLFENQNVLETIVHDPFGTACFVFVLVLIVKSYFVKKPISLLTALAASTPILIYSFSSFRNLLLLWQARHSRIEGLFHPEVVIHDAIFVIFIGICQTIILIGTILCTNLFLRRSSARKPTNP